MLQLSSMSPHTSLSDANDPRRAQLARISGEYSELEPSTTPKTLLPASGSLRERVFALFDDPDSCVLAKWFSVFIMVLIFWSVVVFVVETVHSIHDSLPEAFWDLSEVICVFFFSVEYVMRFVTVQGKVAFFFRPLNLIDLLAIAPFYADLVLSSGGGASTFLRVLRLMRVFRVFKMGKYSEGMQLLGITMSKSASLLGLLIVYLAIALVVFASMIFFAEQGTATVLADGSIAYFRPGEDDPSPYSSIPASFWWSIVTMTTVGYGDVFPVTPVGKVIASVTMLCGVLVLALPINVIGGNFVETYAMSQQRELLKPEERDVRSDKERADYYEEKCAELVTAMFKMQEAMDSTQKVLRELEEMKRKSSVAVGQD